MQKPRVLVVDDDPGIRKFVRANLDARDYEVLLAENGLDAIQMFEKAPVDLIILDIMMPFLDGYEVCRRIREKSMVPIIMLTAKDSENDKLRCLELGADDYITKPFSLNELLCRIKVIFRRTLEIKNSTFNPKFACGELEIDFNHHMVFLKGQEVNLSSTEYKIISFLAMNAGRIIAPEYILEKVWGENNLAKHHLLWVNICRLRNKMDRIYAGNNYIQTRPGLGYLISLNQN
jgi:two-component system, OmpR family, KDP operon response regulator KdpE